MHLSEWIKAGEGQWKIVYFGFEIIYYVYIFWIFTLVDGIFFCLFDLTFYDYFWGVLFLLLKNQNNRPDIKITTTIITKIIKYLIQLDDSDWFLETL
jgi:hypothetical protein